MAGLVLADGATFDPAGSRRWLDAQDAIGPKWRPRYVRILRDPPTTGTNKIVKRTLVHQKFRRRPRRRRRAATCARAATTTYRPFTRRRRARAARVVRALRARTVLGPVAVDLSLHAPTSSAFAAEIRAWLAAHLERAAALRDASPTRSSSGARGRRELAAEPLGRHPLARASTAAAARRRCEVAIFNMEYARSRALQPINRVGINLAGPDAARARHRRAEAALAAGDPHRRRDLVPAVQRARRGLRPRVARRPRAVRVDDGWLLSGQKVWTSLRAVRALGHLPRAHRPRRAEAQGHLVPRRRHAGARASRCGRSCRSPATPSSTRCSSTRCSCPTTTSSAGCTTAGRSRTRRSRTSAARRSRSRSRSCTRCTSTSSGSSRPQRGRARRRRDRRRARAVVRRAARAAAAQLAHAVAARARASSPGPESSITKLAWTDMTQALSARALDVVGAAAPLWWGADDNPGGGFWQRQWLWSKAASIAGGTSRGAAHDHRRPHARPAALDVAG